MKVNVSSHVGLSASHAITIQGLPREVGNAIITVGHQIMKHCIQPPCHVKVPADPPTSTPHVAVSPPSSCPTPSTSTPRSSTSATPAVAASSSSASST